MNKSELVDYLYQDNKTDGTFDTKAAAEKAVNAVIDGIRDGLLNDKKVQLVGFGSFSVKERKERMGRNPRTGQPIKIKKSKTVGFTPGKALKDSIK